MGQLSHYPELKSPMAAELARGIGQGRRLAELDARIQSAACADLPTIADVAALFGDLSAL